MADWKRLVLPHQEIKLLRIIQKMEVHAYVEKTNKTAKPNQSSEFAWRETLYPLR